MDESTKNKIITWMQKKITIQKCECCSENQWTLGEDLVNHFVFHGNNNLIIGGKSYPCAMLICTSCGNTKFFNAVIMGIVQSGEKKNG